MRLIDADELKDALLEESYECHQFCYPCKTIIDVIDASPTVEPEDIAPHESCTDCPLYDCDRHNCPRFNKVIPKVIMDIQSERKKGKWVKHVTGHNIYYDCSRCSYIAPWMETADAILWEMTNYCPNCGARMEGEQDEDERSNLSIS